MSLRTVWFLCLLILSGCLDNVSVQNRYNEERDECRSQAEERFSQYAGEASELEDRARNTELATLFSQCMRKRGWTVATPNRGRDTAQNQPFPGQTNPPPVNASTVAPAPATATAVPAPLILAPTPGYMPYRAPTSGAVIAPPPAATTPVKSPSLIKPSAKPPVSQPSPRPVTKAKAEPSLEEPTSRPPTSAQELLDHHLTSEPARP
jgi:hypothetical protein